MFDSLVDSLKTNIDELNGHEVQYLAISKNITMKTQNILLKIGFFQLPNIESGE